MTFFIELDPVLSLKINPSNQKNSASNADPTVFVQLSQLLKQKLLALAWKMEPLSLTSLWQEMG